MIESLKCDLAEMRFMLSATARRIGMSWTIGMQFPRRFSQSQGHGGGSTAFARLQPDVICVTLFMKHRRIH